MKKKLFALSGVFMIVLVIAGLWATRATDINGVQQASESATISPASEMSTEQMAQGAALIVEGDCTGTKSQWVERRLYTLATVTVKESLKGSAPEKVTIAIPGGTDGNRRFPIAMTYAGAPQFSLGERVVVFLDDTQSEIPDSYSVMGFAQGKFSINKANDGDEVVMRDMTKAAVQTGAGAIRGNLQSVKLSEFKAWLRSYLNK
jgi:hypothetical protein